MSHQAPMASRPAVEPAPVTRAQRALCTILVAATLGVALTLLSAAPAHAARRASKESIPTVPQLVARCAAWARGFEPGFDAYWEETTMTTQAWGVPHGVGTFQFNKCVASPRPGYPHGFAGAQLRDTLAASPALAPPPPPPDPESEGRNAFVAG